MQSQRQCSECGRGEPEVRFFKVHPVCRQCVYSKTLTAERKTLEEGLAEHVAHKEAVRRRREELKKIARDNRKNKKAKKRAAAREVLIPTVETGAVDVTPAQQELAQRELARRRLIEFIKEFHPRYLAGWVHHDICHRLEQFVKDVAAGKNPRLMILMPPRHGKSQIASKMLPPWVLGHYPWFEIIACSYNVSLALEFSREARGMVRADRYNILFPNTQIDPDYQGAEAWKLLSKTGVGAGGYVAAGIGGPITGKGAHILIIDDPIKNAEEAGSLEHRQKIWDWYRSTAYTRLAPGGGVLVIQTWWHDDDLAGRLQEEMKQDPEADKFEVIKYPAIAIEDEAFRAEGDPLHPERYDLEQLLKIKRTVGPRYWAALYQQDPVPDDGAYFTKDKFVYRTEGLDLKNLYIYQAWDFAISEKRDNDWTVGVTIGVDYEDNAHVIEVRRFKTTDSSKIVDQILDMYAAYDRVQVVAAEDGQIWRTMQALLKKRCTERRVYPHIEVQKPLTDKMVRARPLQGRMELGKVTFPKNARWMETLERELLRFPSGIHDDQVDALAWAVTCIIGRSPPPKPVWRGRKPEKTMQEQLRALGKLGGGSHMAA